MNYKRIVLAGVAGIIADLAYGFLVYGMLIANAYNPYQAVYRTLEDTRNHMALGFAGYFIAMVGLAAIYAKGYEGGSGAAEGARFGFLFAIFMIFGVVGTNYITLNIGPKLALAQAGAALFEWPLIGIVIGLVYKPQRKT